MAFEGPAERWVGLRSVHNMEQRIESATQFLTMLHEKCVGEKYEEFLKALKEQK